MTETTGSDAAPGTLHGPTGDPDPDDARTATGPPDVEDLDVLVVGAGLSGVAAGHYLAERCGWARWAIFEARDAIGGTWDLFRYPGIRSDSDMFTLGYSFRPWDDDVAIADGASILRYITETARVEGIDRHIRFHHRVLSADWDSRTARWNVVAERTDTAERVRVRCRFLFSCAGYYRYDRGYEPDLPGRDTFGGRFIHPQHWPEDLDWRGAKVVVIGSGATAITLVPALAAEAGHVTMLQRSPTWIASVPGRDPVARLARRLLGRRRSAPLIRWYKALVTQASYQLSRRRPDLMRRLLLAQVRRQLPEGYDVETHFTPRYDPWDQRLCAAPDGDFFRAIREGRVSVVTDHIDRITPTGIRLVSGRHLEADIIVCATGLELLFIGGMRLSVDGSPVEISDRLTWKGMMLEGVPNFAIAVGYTNASWTLKCELTCDYVTRVLNHMRATGLRQVTPVNEDPAVVPEPLLPLRSGYILRARDRFPKQGSRHPWRVNQSYLADYRAIRRSPVPDEGLVFSNPEPADTATAAREAA